MARSLEQVEWTGLGGRNTVQMVDFLSSLPSPSLLPLFLSSSFIFSALSFSPFPLHSSFPTGSYYIAQAGLEPMPLLYPSLSTAGIIGEFT